MLKTTFRPIQQWPRPFTKRRQRSPFRAVYSDTLGKLEIELRHLGAREVILQLALSAGQILKDGSRPYAEASPNHPGVIVAFQSKFGPKQVACDQYTHWHANLRGIVLGLESLRAVDRYGITARGEQYTGFPQLAAPDGPQTEADAIEVLRKHAGIVFHDTSDPELTKQVFRRAVKNTHPDQGGDVRDFKHVMSAAELLGIRGGA